jgi:TPP-dependent 2-oxoacid decarboxylase
VACPLLQASEAEVTLQQEANEKASIEEFIEYTMKRQRPRGTNAAVTLVMLEAARAAANAAVRHANGAIDQEQAAEILKEAARLMTKKGK